MGVRSVRGPFSFPGGGDGGLSGMVSREVSM